MERQEGYYWVKWRSNYIIANWESGQWWILEDEDCFKDEHFEFINENRIKAPGELPD